MKARTAAGWFISVVLLPAAFFALLEIVLWIGGYGLDTRPFIPRELEGEWHYVRNKSFNDQFFSQPITDNVWQGCELAIPEHKPLGAYRIFVLGSSAALGWPASQYSFSNILESMLETAYPDARFEVYNLAYGGMNSHVMRVLADACRDLHPDAFLVYMGNNEFHGPFGVVTNFRTNPRIPKSATAQAWIVLNRFRVFQWLSSWRISFDNGFGAKKAPPRPLPYPGSPERVRVCANFRDNLQAICSVAAQAGAPVFLSTVGANYRHWAPFKPQHLKAISAEQAAAWDNAYAEGTALLQQKDYSSAQARFKEAEAIEPMHAGLLYVLGQCAWALSDFEAAHDYYARALDLDTYDWVRCKPDIQAEITSTAQSNPFGNAYLVDAAATLERESPQGITGIEFFPDSCHMNFAGSYRVAREFFQALIPHLPESIRKAPSEEPVLLTQEQSAYYLGYTASEQLRITKEFANASQVFGKDADPVLAEIIKELETRAASEFPAQRLQAFSQALQSIHYNSYIWSEHVSFLLGEGRKTEVLTEAEAYVSRLRYSVDALRLLGEALWVNGQPEAAMRCIEKALCLYPDNPGLAMTRARYIQAGGSSDGALAIYRNILRRNPGNAEAVSAIGLILSGKGAFQEAISLFRKALEADPSSGAMYSALTRVYLEKKDIDGLESEWRSWTARFPDIHLGYLQWGLALEMKGDQEKALAELRRAQEMRPKDREVLDTLSAYWIRAAQRYAGQGNIPQSAAALEQAKLITKELPELVLKQGEDLLRAGFWPQAIESFRAAIHARPGDELGYTALESAYCGLSDREGLIKEWQSLVQEMPAEAFPKRYLDKIQAMSTEAFQGISGAAPENPTAGYAQNERAAYERAESLLAEKRYEEAVKSFREAQLHPGLAPQAKDGEARALELFGDQDAAVTAFKEAIELAPEAYGPYGALDRIFSARGDLSGLEQCWMQMVEKHPERPLAWFCLGLARERKSDVQGAEEAYEQSLNRAPNAAGTRDALARVLKFKGDWFQQQGQIEKAQACYQRIENLRVPPTAP